MNRPIKISPSILSADFGAFATDMETLIGGGADYIHIDVMDGHFVPNLTFGPELVRALRRRTNALFDTHLMIESPDRSVEDYAEAGSSLITVHPEVCYHLHRVIHQIKDAGAKAGVALNPATPIEMIEWILPDIDRVLVMTVNPGFGGQKFLDGVLPKITALREREAALGLSFEIGVDGGVSKTTAPLVVKAGADVLIAGSAVFSHPDGPAAGIAEIRRAAESARE